MQYVRWSVVGLLFFYAGITASFPLIILVENYYLSWKGRKRSGGVSTMPFVATLILIISSPLYWENKFLLKIALALTVLDLGWVVVALFWNLLEKYKAK